MTDACGYGSVRYDISLQAGVKFGADDLYFVRKIIVSGVETTPSLEGWAADATFRDSIDGTPRLVLSTGDDPPGMVLNDPTGGVVMVLTHEQTAALEFPGGEGYYQLRLISPAPDSEPEWFAWGKVKVARWGE